MVLQGKSTLGKVRGSVSPLSIILIGSYTQKHRRHDPKLEPGAWSLELPRLAVCGEHGDNTGTRGNLGQLGTSMQYSMWTQQLVSMLDIITDSAGATFDQSGIKDDRYLLRLLCECCCDESFARHLLPSGNMRSEDTQPFRLQADRSQRAARSQPWRRREVR